MWCVSHSDRYLGQWGTHSSSTSANLGTFSSPLSKQGGADGTVLPHAASRRFLKQSRVWDQHRESFSTPPEPEFTRFPRAKRYFVSQVSSHCWRRGGSAEGANATKTLCGTKQANIWQVLASAGQAVTLEGVDRNAGALSELRGKYWLQRPFFVQREKSIFQSPSHRPAFWCLFFFSFSFFPSYGFQLCETGSQWPLEKRVNA